MRRRNVIVLEDVDIAGEYNVYIGEDFLTAFIIIEGSWVKDLQNKQVFPDLEHLLEYYGIE